MCCPLKHCSFQGILIPLDPHLKNPSKKQMWALRTSLSRQWYGKKQHSYSASRSKESGKIHRRCHNETGDIPSRQAITYPTYEENHRTESQPEFPSTLMGCSQGPGCHGPWDLTQFAAHRRVSPHRRGWRPAAKLWSTLDLCLPKKTLTNRGGSIMLI